MQTKLDKQLQQRIKERQQAEKNQLKSGSKRTYVAEQRAKVQQSGGLSGTKPLAIIAPFALARTVVSLAADLRRYGAWPYAILAFVGLRAYQHVQEDNQRLRRREDWEKQVATGTLTVGQIAVTKK